MTTSVLSLAELCAGLVDAPVANSIAISGLTLDSRQVRSGDAFVALSGTRDHGLAHSAEALAAGASCVLFEPPLPAGFASCGQMIAVPGLRAALGNIADRFYGSPSQNMTVVGITGTNGKTSTAQLLAQVLTAAGIQTGTIGTLGAGMTGHLMAGERTTPDVLALHRELATLRAAAATHVVMEVSSHALDQGRVDAVAFDLAVFTNLTRDHLDYHGNLEAYGTAKAKLFAWTSLQATVINLDDAFGRHLFGTLAEQVRRIGISTRNAAEATLRAERVHLSPAGLSFELAGSGTRIPVESPLLGRFNIDNLLAVAGILLALDWPLARVAESLAALTPVTGRMNRLGGASGQPLVVVDYAHTPDALGQALASLREHLTGRLTCVFGCGGERDRGKRPQMAAVAEEFAERIIVTDDNPRLEDGDAIVADIMTGFQVPGLIRVQRDRAAAIATALAEAQPGDIVLIAGKGHENYQEIGAARRPFDDYAIAHEYLERYV